MPFLAVFLCEGLSVCVHVHVSVYECWQPACDQGSKLLCVRGISGRRDSVHIVWVRMSAHDHEPASSWDTQQVG